MKKLVLFAVVIVAVSFASCKQKTTAPIEATVEEVVLTNDEVPADTIVDAIVVEEAE